MRRTIDCPPVRRDGAGADEDNAGARAPLRANAVVVVAKEASPVRLSDGFKIKQAA